MMKINENGVNREMTSDEVIAYNARVAEFQAQEANEAEAAALALEARKAPLRRLGLTEDEINTVLGI